MKRGINIDKLRRAIKDECDFQGLPADVVMGKTRQKEFKELRQMIHYALMDLYILLPTKCGIETLISYEELGNILGKDHATLLHTKNKLGIYFKLYKEEKAAYARLRERMAKNLDINIENQNFSDEENVKMLYYHFRMAEKDYDVKKQAKYRKLLDEKLGFSGIQIGIELERQENE
jgi:hypothetical protein